MKVKEVFYGKIPERELVIDQGEAAARLQTARGYSSDLTEKCEKNIRGVLDCGYAALRTEISFPSNGEVDLGFATVKSKDLYKNLSGCAEAFVFAVTLGYGVDRLIKKAAALSVSEHFITDALSSALAESACDRTEEILRGKLELKPRFSPGYGDLSLDLQPSLLAAVGAGKALNIALSEQNIMSPSKSVTAIIGIKR